MYWSVDELFYRNLALYFSKLFLKNNLMDKCISLRYAMTNDHKLGGLHNRNAFPQFWSQKSKIKVLEGPYFLQRL